MQEEVTITLKELRNFCRFPSVDKPVFKLQMHRCWELALLNILLDQLNMLFRLKMIVAASSLRIHHHFVLLSLWIHTVHTIEHNWLILELFRVLRRLSSGLGGS